MEGIHCDEMHTSRRIKNEIKTEYSLSHEDDKNQVELDSELQEEFYAIMESIKCEEVKNIAEQMPQEAVDISPAVLLFENHGIPITEQSMEFSDAISALTGDTLSPSLCRLCATPSNGLMVHMFGNEKARKHIVEQIEYCFPITVKSTDTLPKQICRLCLEKLELCYQFHKTVSEAERQLLMAQRNEERSKTHESQTISQKLQITDTTVESHGIISNSNEDSRTRSSKTEHQSKTKQTAPIRPMPVEDFEEKLKFGEKMSVTKTHPTMTRHERFENPKKEAKNSNSRNGTVFCKQVLDGQILASTHASPNYYGCSLCGKIFHTAKEWDKHNILEHTGSSKKLKRKGETHGSNECGKKSLTEAIRLKFHKLNDKMNEYDEVMDSETSDQRMHTVHRQLHKKSSYDVYKMQSRALEQLTALQTKWNFGYKRGFDCTLCKRKFRSNYSLEMHKKNVCSLQSAEENFRCMYCGLGFRQKGTMTIHLRTHTRERPYRCDICDKSFTTKLGRDTHRRIHTGERLHKCDRCDKAFTVASKLRRHSIVHSSIRPYKCPVCPQWFKTSNARKIHMTVHTGEKPYKCDICGWCFRRKYQLKMHRLRRHD